jgi:hypothetical protein
MNGLGIKFLYPDFAEDSADDAKKKGQTGGQQWQA